MNRCTFGSHWDIFFFFVPSAFSPTQMKGNQIVCRRIKLRAEGSTYLSYPECNGQWQCHYLSDSLALQTRQNISLCARCWHPTRRRLQQRRDLRQRWAHSLIFQVKRHNKNFVTITRQFNDDVEWTVRLVSPSLSSQLVWSCRLNWPSSALSAVLWEMSNTSWQ